MFFGAHVLVYTDAAESDRAFFDKAMSLGSVDVGGGWTILAMPPSELAFHPAEGNAGKHEMWLMCRDMAAAIARLRELGATDIVEPADRGWGIVSGFKTPGGTAFSLYEPRHPTTFDAAKPQRPAPRAKRGSKKPAARTRKAGAAKAKKKSASRRR